MRNILSIASAVILGISFLTGSAAQEAKPPEQTSNEERVYKKSEVTRPAIIKSRPEAVGDITGCPEKGEIRIRLVLHKSGKVTEVKLLRGLGKRCSFEKSALEAAKGVEFVPAIKDGVPVSQYLILMYVYGERVNW